MIAIGITIIGADAAEIATGIMATMTVAAGVSAAGITTVKMGMAGATDGATGTRGRAIVVATITVRGIGAIGIMQRAMEAAIMPIEIVEIGTMVAGIMEAGVMAAGPMATAARMAGIVTGHRAVLRRQMMVSRRPARQGPLPAMVARAAPGPGLATPSARADIVAGGMAATAIRMVAGRAEAGTAAVAICMTVAAALITTTAVVATRPVSFQ